MKFILKVSPITMDTYAEKPKNKYLKELTSVFYQKKQYHLFNICLLFCLFGDYVIFQNSIWAIFIKY